MLSQRCNPISGMARLTSRQGTPQAFSFRTLNPEKSITAIYPDGDRHLRGLLYEAATVILTRSSSESTLRTWGLQLRERIGFKRDWTAVGMVLSFPAR